MSSIKYTKDQEKGINKKERDLLLSASAGSGKTAVLVERVINKIINQELNLNQLLIVTFTEAAAEGMSKKIKQALEKKLAHATDSNERNFLVDQLQQLPTANISTLHAFCLSVIKRFYYVIDLDPSFSLLTDEVQAQLLKESALTTVFNRHLENHDEVFQQVLDNFSTAKNIDGTEELVQKLYQSAIAQPNPTQFLEKIVAKYQDENYLKNLITENLYPNLIAQIKSLRQTVAVNKTIDLTADKSIEKIYQALSSLDNSLLTIQQMIEQKSSFDDVRAAIFDLEFATIRKGQKMDEDTTADFLYLKEKRDQVKDVINKLKTNYFAIDFDAQKRIFEISKTLIEKIVEVTLEFKAEFDQLKRDRNFLDFNDLEQLSYTILSGDTTNTQLARDFYQNKFSEIMVDEYQDTNDIQEAIIQTIKKPGQNYLFMVGDVKQSIYGFRQAKPDLFIDKFNTFVESDSPQQKINLMENFRSTKPVINFVNHVFNNVLTKEFGGVNYQQDGQLVFGAEYYQDDLPAAVEIALFDTDEAKTINQISADQNADFEELDVSEIKVVINRIKKMQDEHFQVSDVDDQGNRIMRDFNLNDVAILTRTKSNNFDILDEFTKAGLAVDASDAINYFQTFELNVILSYLKIIDNPDQDIPLVGVLRSPLYNFNENEFAKIRIANPKNSFYTALTHFPAENDRELAAKISNFLAALNEFRGFEKTHRISELVWHIYESTHLMEIVLNMPNGRQRRVNLQALYERANNYEAAGFKGLYQFINFINKMRQKDKDLAQPLLTDEENEAITLSTIHKSKGLEYPIVFVVDLNHQFNLSDQNANYLIDDELGMGISVIDGFIKQEPLIKSLIRDKSQKKLNEEEARLLYVALTRAQQKLILVLNQSKINLENTNLGKIYQSDTRQKIAARKLSDFLIPSLDLNNYISVNDLKLRDQINNELLVTKYQPEDLKVEQLQGQNLVDENLGTKFTEFNNIEQYVKDSYQFQYPFVDASKTTSYQAVSEIKQVFSDPDLIQLENAQVNAAQNRYLQPLNQAPDFINQTKFTPAQKGTAVHLILQKHDFNRAFDQNTLAFEVQSLVEQGLLNQNLAAELDLSQIAEFLQSDFARTIAQNAKTLEREVSFSSLIKADQLFQDFSDPTSKILVHGTIDAYFINDNQITLWDYKTDHVPNNPTAIKEFLAKYQGQLNFYQKALEEIYRLPVTQKSIVSLSLNQTFSLN